MLVWVCSTVKGFQSRISLVSCFHWWTYLSVNYWLYSSLFACHCQRGGWSLSVLLICCRWRCTCGSKTWGEAAFLFLKNAWVPVYRNYKCVINVTCNSQTLVMMKGRRKMMKRRRRMKMKRRRKRRRKNSNSWRREDRENRSHWLLRR